MRSGGRGRPLNEIVRRQMSRDEALASLTRKKKALTQEALVNAARNGAPHLVGEYLAAGFDVNAADGTGDTPLGVAVERNDPEIVRYLLANGAKANDSGYFFHAVHDAPFIGSVEIIDLLLEAGCPVDFIEETTGFNALELARDMGDPAVVARLEKLFDV
jgi:ankyrin repeat protein